MITSRFLLTSSLIMLVASTMLKAQTKYWGAIDTTGQTIIPFEYLNLHPPAHGLIVAHKDSQRGIINLKGETVLPFSDTMIQPFKNGMARYYINKQGCGFIDSLGQWAIPMIYDQCRNFHDSLAWVAKEIEDTLRWGLINRQGEELSAFVYDAPGNNYYMDELYKVRRGNCHGLLDRSGQEVGALLYDRLELFNEGKIRAERDGKQGFLNKQGREVIPCEYPRMSYYFHREQAYIKYDDRTVMIDTNGTPFFEDTLYNVASVFDDRGLAYIKEGNKRGLINQQGEVVLPPIYDQILQWVGDVRVLKLKGRAAVVDTAWQEIIPFEYNRVSVYSNGSIQACRQDNCGLIDWNNEVVIPLQYQHIWGIGNDKDYLQVKKGEKVGIIDRSGNVLIPLEYERVVFDAEFPFGLCPFKKDRKIGFLNLRGETKIPFIYSQASPFSKEGIAVCQK